MTINELQDQIIEEFEMFDDWMDRYNYLIDLGKSLNVIDPKYKTDEHVIEGCQSRVWVHAELNNDKIIYSADSDAIITKGIIAILIKVYSNQSAQDILDADLYFIDKIGLRENLSPTRANGLLAMIRQMRLFAMAFNAKSN